MTASERDALEQGIRIGIRMALSHASERKMTAAMLEVYQPEDAHDARVESEAWAALAAVALRELERAGDRDALWREYDTARTDVANADRELRECVARAAEHRYPPAWACQDYVRRSDEAWHRLDAAVRALAAAPPAEPHDEADIIERGYADTAFVCENCGGPIPEGQPYWRWADDVYTHAGRCPTAAAPREREEA